LNSIHVIGLGVTEAPELSQAALSGLSNAQWVIGSPRQLKVVASLLQHQQKLELPPLSRMPEVMAELDRQIEASIAVLASGDPLHYGIGKWFSRHYPSGRLKFYPAVSSIQAACHAVGIALQDTEVLSLHGRPLERIRTKLKRNQTLVVLTDKYSTPQVLARECLAAGLEESQLIVCEAMGYTHQQINRFDARELAVAERDFDPLHVTVIQARGIGGVLPDFPGIPDENFITGQEPGKGMITKKEVRLNILTYLQPANDDVIWDIGSGCGSVAVELAYWNERCRVFAIEHHPDRLACLQANRQRFGVVSNLQIEAGSAPEALESLPAPNKIFIGGSDGKLAELLTLGWSLLPRGGIMAASTVTETSRHQLISFLEQRRGQRDADIETLQLAIGKGSYLADQLLYRPALPVTLFRFIKSKEVSAIEGSH